MADLVQELTEENFTGEVLNATWPVLVDFWAPWCGPCRMLAPILAEIAAELADQLKVVKVNVDENPQLAAKYNIMSIPTLVVFKNGQAVERMVGYMPKTSLVAKIKALL